MVPTCFGLRLSSGSLQWSLAKVILILKRPVSLRRSLLCGGVAACPSMACVLCAVVLLSAGVMDEMERSSLLTREPFIYIYLINKDFSLSDFA